MITLPDSEILISESSISPIDTYENKANYFWLNFALLLFASALMLLLLRWLNKVMKEKGIN